MKQVVQKKLSVFTFMLFAFMLFIYICVTKTVNADDNLVPLEKWTFTQGGQYLPDEPGNEGYINSVTMNDTKEMITGWLKGGEESCNQTQKAIKEATGFAIDIGNTGWDAQWGESPVRINPWSIQASMKEIPISQNKRYIISFKARATQKKYGYVYFSYDDEPLSVLGDNQLITLGPDEQTFTYEISSDSLSTNFTTTFWMGAFNGQFDFEGNDISDIVRELEIEWKGTVYISDFKIVEHPSWYRPIYYDVTFKDGDNIVKVENHILEGTAAHAPELKKEGYTLSWDQSFNYITKDMVINAIWIPNEIETSTNVIEKDKIIEKEYTKEQNIKVGKTKILKVSKARASDKVKLCLKKVKRASGYQIQISTNRKFKNKLINKKIKKTSFFLSSKKFKGQKKLYIRARALKVIKGCKHFGKWSRVKKVKIK